MNWRDEGGAVAFNVAFPTSLSSLCEEWAKSLGCTPADCVRSLLSCGLAYLLTLDGARGIEPRVAKAISDLAHMAPRNTPVDWYTIDPQTGQLGRTDR